MTDFNTTLPSAGIRKRGRPRGTTLEGVDRPRYDEMEALMEEHKVPSLPAAAKEVLPRAYGFGRLDNEWIVRRLCEGYRRNRST